MRLPIALSPLNILLMILMLAAPFLGSAAKKYTLKRQQDEKLEIIISRTKSSPNGDSLPKIVSENDAAAVPEEKSENTRPSSKTSQNKKQLAAKPEINIKTVPVNLDDQSSKPAETSRKKLFEALKKYARARDFQKAEETFLEHLETSDLSPIESLDKYSKFQEMFQKLSDDYLESSSNKSM